MDATVRDTKISENANFSVLSFFLGCDTIEDDGNVAAETLKDLLDTDVGFELLELDVSLCDHGRERWRIASLRREA
jgi:hypothetical protein